MFNSEDDLNRDLAQNSRGNNADPNLERIDAGVSSESVAIRKKQLESIFTKLIIFGLALGTVLGLGAYYLMHRFGLTKKPYQLEQERIEREQKNSPTPVKQIHHRHIFSPDGDRFEL